MFMGIFTDKQAGLSRATLEISSQDFLYNFLKWFPRRSGKFLLGWVVKKVTFLLKSPNFIIYENKPVEDWIKINNKTLSGLWDIQIFLFWGYLPLEVVFHWSLSSSKPFFTLVWSHEHMFKIWGRSHQWLLRYSNFHILKSSSIRCRLAFQVVFIETFLTLVCSPELMFKIWGKFDQWLLRYSNFHILRSSSIRGNIPLKVVFIDTFLTLVWSHELMFKIWGRSDQWLLRYSNLLFLRSSSTRGHLPLRVAFIETLFDFGLVLWAYV